MCLAIPARIVAIDGDLGVVDMGGVRKEISLALVDDVAIDDYVIVHVGYALSKLDPEEAAKTLALFAEIGEMGEAHLTAGEQEGPPSQPPPPSGEGDSISAALAAQMTGEDE